VAQIESIWERDYVLSAIFLVIERHIEGDLKSSSTIGTLSMFLELRSSD
jgi:hypothetical protein